MTPDGSVTFHNEQYGEAYHSKSGAKEEALKKFAEPCNVKECAKTGQIRILDICFGLGYNSAAALDVALKENPHCSIEIIGLEIDEKILQEILSLDDAFDHYSLIKETIKNNYKYSEENIKIQILLGDARETIKTIKQNVDICFLDPFSPKKCPELWSSCFFKDIAALMKKEGRLATYSCARIVRDNLKEAGFTVFDGPKLWRRGPSTIGVKI